jgi:hypothetical protein
MIVAPIELDLDVDGRSVAVHVRIADEVRSQALSWAVALAVALASVACAHAPARRGPAPAVRAEVTDAEEAERHRRHDVARTHYQRAIALAKDPQSVAFAHREYADTLAEWGEYAAAITEFERAIAADGGDAFSWHELGLLRHKQGDDAGAIAALERSRALAPRDWRPRRSLAILRVKLRDYPAAIGEYRAMLALDLPVELRSAVERGIDLLEAEQKTVESAKATTGVAKP